MRFILQRVYTYWMESSESLSPITLLKMDVKSKLSENFLSTAASNFGDFLTKPGEVDCHIYPTYWLKLKPQGGAVPIIPIRSRQEFSTMPIELPMLPGVLPLTPVLLTLCGVLDVHASPGAVSVEIYFVTGIGSVGEINLITAIPGLVGRGKTGMVLQLNNSCSKFSCKCD